MFLGEDAVSAVNEVAAESRASGQMGISEKQQDGGVRTSLQYWGKFRLEVSLVFLKFQLN